MTAPQMDENCRISVVGTALSATGPTPVGAPFLASELLAELLRQIPADAVDAAPVIRIELAVRALLTFSFELRAPVVEQLGALGATLECCINADEPELERFACDQDGAHLIVWTNDRDPHEVTARTGIEPTSVLRKGEPIDGPRSRLAKRGSWLIEIEREPAEDISALARQLCDRFPPRAADACRDFDLRLRFTFMIQHLCGGVRFERDVVESIAARRMPLACYFYNISA